VSEFSYWTHNNDVSISVLARDGTPIDDRPVRNGNRWKVHAIDPATNRLAAERVDDGARAVFSADYARDHINLGYAVTVHSAQGVTADTSHAVLGENTTRAVLYVAILRGRDTNTAYLYERTAEAEYPGQPVRGTHALRRDDSKHAAGVVRLASAAVALMGRVSLPSRGCLPGLPFEIHIVTSLFANGLVLQDLLNAFRKTRQGF
jgi:hypothetical protein